MPQLQKGYKNNKNHRLAIDDALVKWAGWPMGPYGGKEETYEVKDAKGKVTETKLKGNLTEVAPYINVEQHEEYNVALIQAMSKDSKWTPTVENGGIIKQLILTWTK
jgi:hypothetical protein